MVIEIHILDINYYNKIDDELIPNPQISDCITPKINDLNDLINSNDLSEKELYDNYIINNNLNDQDPEIDIVNPRNFAPKQNQIMDKNNSKSAPFTPITAYPLPPKISSSNFGTKQLEFLRPSHRFNLSPIPISSSILNNNFIETPIPNNNRNKKPSKQRNIPPISLIIL